MSLIVSPLPYFCDVATLSPDTLPLHRHLYLLQRSDILPALLISRS